MAYTTAEARQRLLDDVAEATEAAGLAVAALGAAYEQLDERTADALEEQLFRPAQSAYGRARRVHDDFAARHGMPARAFPPASPGAPSGGPRAYVETAVGAAGRADAVLAELQDSMIPIEVGDPELRASLAAVRESLDQIPGRARELLRTLGR